MSGLVRWIVMAMVLAMLGACASGGDEFLPPEMRIDVASELSITAGEDVVIIQINASDPQDQELTFEAVQIPDRATFDTYRNQAIFQWDPISSDVTDDEPHRLVFAVSNEAGLKTERTVHVHVRAGEEGSRFLSSSSQLYNPTSGAPLIFDVRVRNDAASQVILSMPTATAPEGATFEQTQNFQGVFEWMPNPEQTEQRTHHVVFEADDGEEVVSQTVTIVIQDPEIGVSPPSGGGTDPEAGTCEGESIFDHIPLTAQRSALDYSVKGSLTDSAGEWDDVLLYWTTDDPILVEPEYEVTTMQFDGQSFAGAIPNPGLSPGQTVEISYALCALSTTVENLVCTPEDFLYRFIAYHPDDEVCQDDGIDLSEPGSAAPISRQVWEPFRVCGAAPKYHDLTLNADEVVDIAVSFPPDTDQKIDITLDGELVDAEEYHCIGLIYARVEGPGTVLVRVAGDEMPYHMIAFGEPDPDNPDPLPQECRGEHYEPNNTPAQATLVVDDTKLFDDTAICEEDDIDVYAIRLVRGDQFSALMSFEHALGDLDMTLFAPSQSGEVVDGGFGVAQGWSSDDDELISYTATESGFYYLSVVTSSEPNDYDLLVERTCVVDDQYAGNHSSAQAHPVSGFFEASGLKLCENQADYFRLTPDGGSATWLGYIRPVYGSMQSFEVTVFDGSGNVVAQGQPGSDDISITVDTAQSGPLDLRIEASSPALYELEIIEIGE